MDHANESDLQDPVGEYFREFLHTLENELLIADLESLTTCFAIDVADRAGPPWCIAIERGRLQRVAQGGRDSLCCFRLDSETLLEVVAAEIAPAEAFFAKRIDLSGDMELGLKLSTVLAPFFAAFPFRP